MDSTNLAAHLDDLKTIADVDLQMLAYTYATLNNVLAETAPDDTTAFATWGPADPVFGPWTTLRDDLRGILGQTVSVLQATAVVLDHIIDVYAATDDEAARSLRSSWQSGPHRLQPGEAVPPGPTPTVLSSVAD